MRILVTGGLGFVGSAFVRWTLANKPDAKVVIYDAFTYAADSRRVPIESERLRIIQGDVRDEAAVNEAVRHAHLVVHFAAESHNDNSLSNPRIFLETNVLGTFNILEAVRRYGVRLHHISTDEVFGDLDFDGPEKFDLHSPVRPSSPYSSSKASSDLMVRAWVRSFGVNATISNCSNNFGPFQHEEKFIPASIALAEAGERPRVYGKGLNVRDWIHVDDHARGVWAVIENGAPGQTFLLGGVSVLSNLEVVAMINRLFGLPKDYVEFVDDRPGHDRRYEIDWSLSEKLLAWRPELSLNSDSLAELLELERQVGWRSL